MTEVSAGTLTDFLLARLSEDEAAVRSLREHGGSTGIPGRCREHSNANGWDWIATNDWDDSYRLATSSARVLAECDAKRRVAQWHALVVGEDQGGKPVTGCANCIGAEAGQTFTIEGPCLTLRLLALPYAGHAEFNPAWRL